MFVFDRGFDFRERERERENEKCKGKKYVVERDSVLLISAARVF